MKFQKNANATKSRMPLNFLNYLCNEVYEGNETFLSTNLLNFSVSLVQSTTGRLEIIAPTNVGNDINTLLVMPFVDSEGDTSVPAMWGLTRRVMKRYEEHTRNFS